MVAVTAVEPLAECTLRLTFDDGSERVRLMIDGPRHLPDHRAGDDAPSVPKAGPAVPRRSCAERARPKAVEDLARNLTFVWLMCPRPIAFRLGGGKLLKILKPNARK